MPTPVPIRFSMTHAGHIAIAGAPNAGKSSLLNALVGSHLAIVSPKAQSTRLPVTGIRTDSDTQYIFHDLPGLLDPRYPLQERMRAAGQALLGSVHLILHLHPADQGPVPEFWPLTGLEKPLEVPVLTVRTKSDLQPGTGTDALSVSATTGAGLEQLLEQIRAHLPVAPFEYADDDIGTQPVRFFAAEYLREAAFELLADELPYSVAVEVEEFREHTRPIYIRVTLLVERESQKGIVIGQGGQMLKALGVHARMRLEELLGASVYLDCWVKVLPGWRRSAAALDRLGFPEPRD
jgi:GTP-binding protein Era